MSPKEEHLREWNQEEFKNYLTSHNFEILFHKNTPFMKMNMTYPFVLEYTKKTFL